MHYSETDVVTGRFIASGAVANESCELYNGQVRNVGILNHGSDVTAATECAASGTFRENLSGGGDAFGANRSKAVATVKSQREPPTRNSATQSARAEITRNAPMRSARADRKGLSFMI
jgi:hypothetical protein